MAHNETQIGLNEPARVPRRWSRSTVADGQWMQKNTLSAYRASDWFLAGAIDGLLDKDDELTQAIADEAAARQENDSDLSAWCRNLVSSAEDLYNGLATEISDRKQNCDDASAHAYDLSKSYTDDASGKLDKRIDGVSGAFSSFRDTINNWKDNTVTPTLDVYSAYIGSLQDKTAQLSVDIKTSADKVREEFATGDEFLQNQIDALTRANDVVDVVDTSAKLNPYHGYITSGDIIKVLDGENHMQEYWQFSGAQTAQDPQFNKFTRIGTLQPYYSVSEINSMFGNYYPKSELYTKTDVDGKLANKLDTSAEHIWKVLTVQIGQQPGQYVNMLNDMEILADRAERDRDGNFITSTYATNDSLSAYAKELWVKNNFASANNVYAKNETSGKEQLSTAFGNKLDASAAFTYTFRSQASYSDHDIKNVLVNDWMRADNGNLYVSFLDKNGDTVSRGFIRGNNGNSDDDPPDFQMTPPTKLFVGGMPHRTLDSLDVNEYLII